MAHEIVGKRNLSFSRFFSPPHSRILIREEDCHSMLSVQKMKTTLMKAKGKRDYIISKISSHLGRPASKRHLWRLQHFLAVEFWVSVFLILKIENDICDRK